MAVTTAAVQILGGYGYIKEYPTERFMRDRRHAEPNHCHAQAHSRTLAQAMRTCSGPLAHP